MKCVGHYSMYVKMTPLLVFPSGIASMTVPVYIAEVSPPHSRGQLVTINVLFVTGGQFIASVIDGAFSYLSHDGWRYVLVSTTTLFSVLVIFHDRRLL